MGENWPTVIKFPSSSLERFYEYSRKRLDSLKTLQRLGFKRQEVKHALSAIKPHGEYYRISYSNGKRCISFFLCDETIGHYIISIFEKDTINDGAMFDLQQYYKSHGNKDAPEPECFRLINYDGNLKQRVDQALDCMNHLLEGRIEAVLSGDEWIDIPMPGYFDYK